LVAQCEFAGVAIIKQEFTLGIGDTGVIVAPIVEATHDGIQEDGSVKRLAAGVGATAIVATIAAATVIVTTTPASGQHDTGQHTSHCHTQHVFFIFITRTNVKNTAPSRGPS